MSARHRRDTSAASATRFRALLTRRVGASRRSPGPGLDLGVPEEWCYVESKLSGAYVAWLTGPNAPAGDFVLGVTGKPRYAVAIGRGLYWHEHQERRYFRLIGGRWTRWTDEEQCTAAAASKSRR